MSKNIFKAAALLLVITFLISSCFGPKPNDNNASFYFDHAKNIGPRFYPAVAGQSITSKVAPPWDSGNLLYQLYYLMRNFNPATDEGVIDGSNMYKALHGAGTFYTHALNFATPITRKVINSPYDLGKTVEYDHAVNRSYQDNGNTYHEGLAFRVEGDMTYSLVGATCTEGTKNTYQVLQCENNIASGDMDLVMTYIVVYSQTNKYGVRVELTGNEITHAFTIRSLKYSLNGVTETWMSIAGKGISQGAGNYFLFKECSSVEAERYYVFPAGATETDLQNMDYNGYTYNTIPAEGAPYQVDVAAMVFLTSAQVPKDISDFTNSSTDLIF